VLIIWKKLKYRHIRKITNMKKSTCLSFSLLAIFTLIAISPSAFAEHGEGGMSATVTNSPGSATPGCENTDNCFIPSTVVITAGGTVTWENTDNAAHTATSGSPSDGPDGVWDSSLMMVNGSYSVTLDDEGTYPYFCMVHPWMQGTVIVEAAGAAQAEAAAAAEAAMAAPAIDAADYISTSGAPVTSITANADDDSVIIAIDAADDGVLSVTLHSEVITAFDDGTYFVLIDYEEVEFEQSGSSLTIPYGAGNERVEIVGSHAVPEFGTIAMIILAVAIVSIIAITAKTRTTLIPRL